VKIKITLSRSNETKTVTLEHGNNASDLLKKLDIKPDSAIIMINNTPIPVDSDLKDGQHLTLMEISSSG
jgi:sulfur carrier protein ThiS